MARYWTCHWQNKFWRTDVNPEYEPFHFSGSNMFRTRGVAAGDIAYVVTLSDGHLFLGGRMTIKRIVSRKEAGSIWNTDSLYDADEWIIDETESGTLLNLHRRLAPQLSKKLLFVSSKSEPKGYNFVSATRLDNQTTRGIRELTPQSAQLLDRVIDATDCLPRSQGIITVTEELLKKASSINKQATRRRTKSGRA